MRAGPALAEAARGPWQGVKYCWAGAGSASWHGALQHAHALVALTSRSHAPGLYHRGTGRRATLAIPGHVREMCAIHGLRRQQGRASMQQCSSIGATSWRRAPDMWPARRAARTWTRLKAVAAAESRPLRAQRLGQHAPTRLRGSLKGDMCLLRCACLRDGVCACSMHASFAAADHIAFLASSSGTTEYCTRTTVYVQRILAVLCRSRVLSYTGSQARSRAPDSNV